MRRDFDFIEATKRQRGAFAEIQTRCFILRQIGDLFSLRLLQKITRDNVADAFGLFSERFPLRRDQLQPCLLMRVGVESNYRAFAARHASRERALKDFTQG